MRRDSWEQEEVDLLVADYFEMLVLELRGEKYNKSARNERLRGLLSNRSHGSVERKHQNVSAILAEENLPFIDGYKPLRNYQASLREVVLERLGGDKALLLIADRVSQALPRQLSLVDYADPRRQVPPPDPIVRERVAERHGPRHTSPRFGDYAERDARNRELGELGEQFVLEVERRRLHQGSRPDLAKQVVWASRELGDGLGYDIQSFALDGQALHIEVKTTNLGLRFPFLVSRNEVLVSEKLAKSYQLCRVFRFASDPRFFVLPGEVSKSCQLTPRIYSARV